MLNIKRKLGITSLTLCLTIGVVYAGWAPDVKYEISPITGDSVKLLKESETALKAIYKVDQTVPTIQEVDRGLCQTYPKKCIEKPNPPIEQPTHN